MLQIIIMKMNEYIKQTFKHNLNLCDIVIKYSQYILRSLSYACTWRSNMSWNYGDDDDDDRIEDVNVH